MLQVIGNTSHYSQQQQNTFTHFSKCGEIHVNDASTEICLFCSFCTKEDIRVLKTLSEFMEHIKWHRSEDFTINIKDDTLDSYEAVRIEVATDLIDPPPVEAALNSKELDEETKNQDGLEDSPNDVLVKLCDLYKKCPCLWHKETAKEEEYLIEPTYRLLTTQYNSWSGQSKSVDYVRNLLEKLKTKFLVEFTIDEDMSGSFPWYFAHLMFLLIYEEETIDESTYTDLLCPICSQESCSPQDLWAHLRQCHLRLDDGSVGGNDDEFPSPAKEPSLSLELTERLIKEYQVQRRLWDKDCAEFRNQALRNDSFNAILDILKTEHPDATLSDVMAKIKYFRQQHSAERRRILENKRQGVTYESHSWYYQRLKFLSDDLESKNQNHLSEYLVPSYNCHICQKEFNDQICWLDHLQCAHEMEELRSSDGFFYCSICSLQKKTKYSLIRHLRQMHTKNDKTCHDCGTSFRFMSKLARHRADVHNDHDPFKCSECGKGFPSLTRVKIHMVTHWNVEDRPHACPHCNARFSNRANLKVHIKRHTKDFTFKCTICNHASATATELRFHSFTHTKEYPAICDVCGKGFRSQSMLSTHKTECHNDTIFQCAVCYKQFKSEKKLQGHFNNHKDNPDLTCNICGSKFRRKSALHNHMTQKHDSEQQTSLNSISDKDTDNVEASLTKNL